MRFLAHWILAIAFLLRWEIRFWTPNMTCIISFLLNTKSSRWQARNLHIFVEIFLLFKGEKSDEKSLLVCEYSFGFERNKASLDHLSKLTKKVKMEVEISVSSCYSWSRFLRWRGGENKNILKGIKVVFRFILTLQDLQESSGGESCNRSYNQTKESWCSSWGIRSSG